MNGPLVREAGATAILMEYEDMFPFWGTLRNISAKNAYSQRDVQNLQKWAMQNDLIVIPLVQTFGHMEFVLKLDEFKDLREVPIYPQSICPSQDKSWTIIQEMIDQVSARTPNALSFYRSQSIFCRSKCFEPVQKFDCIQ